jgi:hypothetical protein
MVALFFSIGLQAQTETYDLQFVVVTNDGVNLDVLVQIESSATFGLASSDLVFTYSDVSNFGTPSLQAIHNYSGGNYYTMSMTNPTSGRIFLGIVLRNNNAGTGVPTSWTDVATVRFPVTNPSGSTSLAWRTTAPQSTRVAKDLGSNQTVYLTAGILSGLSVNPLPVELTSFHATFLGNSVRTSWVTATEINCYGFDVERSPDGKNWEKAGFAEGQGTSNAPHEYFLIDTDMGNSPSLYYRLKMIDRDGSSMYSEVLIVKSGTPVSVPELHEIYPNPSSGRATLQFSIPSGDAVSVILYDEVGREVRRILDAEYLTAGAYSRTIDVSSLPAGYYHVELTAGGRRINRIFLVRHM